MRCVLYHHFDKNKLFLQSTEFGGAHMILVRVTARTTAGHNYWSRPPSPGWRGIVSPGAYEEFTDI